MGGKDERKEVKGGKREGKRKEQKGEVPSFK